jgi:hypothetical protein
MTYTQLHDNEWVTPYMRGYRIKCCECGLVHVLDFRILKRGKRTNVQFRARRVKTRKRVKKL